MNIRPFLKQIGSAIILFCALVTSAQAVITDISTTPMETDTTTVSAKPNVMFMLDDSGSMNWDYMPDNALTFSGRYGFNSNHCNGVYYDPSYTYTAPIKSDGTYYPDSSFSAAWKDGYNTGAGTVNLNTAFTGGSGTGQSGYTSYSGAAFYYTYTGAQTSATQMNILNTSSTYYLECNSAIGSSPGSTVFSKTRLASIPTTTITVLGGGASGATITINSVGTSKTTKPSVSSITVNGVQLMSGSSSSSSSVNTVATNIAAKITQNSFSATASGNVITITGPTTAAGYSPLIVTYTGTMTYSTTAFPATASGTTVSSIQVNGVELMGATSVACAGNTTCTAGNIAARIWMNGYSATSSGNVITVTGPSTASTYTPVITSSCPSPCPVPMTFTTQAFPESTPAKLQNFANWYSYYSTRMLTMKTGVGQAFAPVSSNYRIGFMTMNNNVSPDIVDIADFVGSCAVGSGLCQKDLWYTKLYASQAANSTPLREALSHVGQLYAHKFGSVSTYTATITVGGSGSTAVDSITVGGTETLNDTAAASASTSTLASNIAAQINAMQITDFGATVSGSVITIYGPQTAYTPTALTPVISNDGGGMTFTATPFTAHTTTSQLNGILPADPIQYSCQQNFVILSTDGYWNGATTYKLDNTTVGQQDGIEPRPMNDGATLSSMTTTQLLQTTSQPKQTQISTSQLQRQTSQLQVGTSTLQTQTSQLQTRTSTLQTQTSQLQTRTSALQSQTSQLQEETGVLQKRSSQLQASTSTLQTQTSQFQISTSTLQRQTSQLQSQTSTLQGTLSKVLMTCANTVAACGTPPATGVAGVGSSTASWSVVNSGTCTITASIQCREVTGLSSVANVATTCNTAATDTYTNTAKVTITVTAEGSLPTISSISIDGHPILTGTTTAPSSNTTAKVATAIKNAVGANGYTATVSGSVVTVTGSTYPITASSSITYTVGSGTATLTGGITGSTSYTLANADSNGKIYSSCAYTGWSTPPVGVATCAAVSQSGTPNNTSVLTARQCNTVPSGYVDTTSDCTASVTPDASGYTTQCRYVAPGTTTVNGWSSWAGTASCTAAAQSAGPTNYTVHPAVQCRTTVTSAFADTTSDCTVVSTPDASGYTTQCRYVAPGTATVNGWSSWADVTSCTAAAQSAGPTNYTVHPAVQCQYAVPGTTTAGWGTWGGAASCSPLAQSSASPYTVGTASECQYVFTNYGVASCAVTPAYVAGNYTNATVYRNCQTAITSLYTNAASCTATTTPNSSGYTTQCQYAVPGTSTPGWSSWGNYASTSCTAAAQSAGPSYTVATARECNTVVSSAWADTAANCTATTTPNSSGVTTQCQYVVPGTTTPGWSSWSNYASTSCTAAAQSAGPSYTVHPARECQTVVTSPWADTTANCTATATPNTSGVSTQCQYVAPGTTTVGGWSAWADATSTCTAAAQSAGPSYTAHPAVRCQYVTPGTSTVGWSAWSNVSSCTALAQSVASPYATVLATQCQYAIPGTSTVGWSAYSNASSCTAVPQDLSNPYDMTATGGVATQCQTVANSCTAGVGGCNTVVTGPVGVASCTPTAPSAGNSYLTTTCNTLTVGPTPAATCTAVAASAANNYTATSCIAGTTGTSNTLADVAEYYYVNDLRDNSLGNCTGALGSSVCTNNVLTATPDVATWQHMTTFTLGLGARGRMIYSPSYTSLSTGCTPSTDGDYCSVLTGATADGSLVCSWQSAGSICNWPTPSSGAIENIDDLWHAAVNGRGTYFSARDPSTLASSLSSTLSNITARVGAAAAAASSNPNVSSGDNFVFSSSYTSVDWTGELIRQQISLSTGAVSSVLDWCANGPASLNGHPYCPSEYMLDALAAATPNGGSRLIYTYNPSAAGHTGDAAAVSAAKLKSFTYTNLTVAEQANFDAAHIAGLSQFCVSGSICLSGASQTAAAGSNLVNFLRGDRSNEGDLTTITKYYRARPHILGDIVNAEVAYVKQPQYSYGDAGYTDFVSTKTSRTSMVYAASNDGMLHAFYGGGLISCVNSGGVAVSCDDVTAIRLPCAPCGQEAWAYIPALVLPNLYVLADKNYSTLHRYLVDGTPITGDVCPNAPGSACTANDWKTILVGGLNLGGRGYYALDVTDPLNPKALWEFSDSNMGYTFGNPQIAKLADGTWVVMVTSGYNNIPNADGAGGDGVGRLYILNAYTGALIRTISTGVGSLTSPSGLARIGARVRDPATDNTALEVYGGDLLGNLWRFDVNNNVGATTPAYEAQLLATLKDPAGTVQPITTKPEAGIVSNQLVIFVGTGKFMGTSDLTNTQVQTMYAIKDTLATSSVAGTALYNNPRASTCASPSSTSCFVQQTATNTICPETDPLSTICSPGQSVRTGSNNAVNFTSQSGWYIDMPDSGERDNTDPTLSLGTLGFVSNTPSAGSGCTVLGYSYRWFLDYRTGAPVATSTTHVISNKLSDTFATRPVYVRLPNNTVVELTRTSTGNTVTSNVPIGNAGSVTRRTSWRELLQE